MHATLPGFASPASSVFIPKISSCSIAYLCSLPISIGLSIPHLEQASSQSLSYGHTLAQLPPNTLFDLIVSAAPLTFLNLIDLTNFAGSVPAGQPLLHGASWHSKHLAASSIAVLCVNPATDSAVYAAFTTLLNVTPPLNVYIINEKPAKDYSFVGFINLLLFSLS